MRAFAVSATPLSAHVAADRTPGKEQRLGLSAEEKTLLAVWFVCGAIAVVFPYPATKLVLAVVMGVTYLRASLSHFYLALSGFILLFPFLDVGYKGSILLPGVNLHTLFVLYLLLIAAASAEPDVARGSVHNPAAKPLLCLVGLMVASAVFVSATSSEGFFDLLTRIKNSFAYATLMWAAFRVVKNPRQKLMIVICLFIAVLVNVLFSLREVSLTLALSLSFMRHRATSLISNQPNLYAGFLSLYLFLFIAFLMYYPSSRVYRFWLLCATCLIVMNLIYTMSRGAWLACIVSAACVAGMKSRRLLLPLALIGMLIYLWAPEMAAERWESSFYGEYSPTLLVQEEDIELEEAATRIVQWRSFLPMMAKYPIFGVGFGKYGEFFESGGYYDAPKSAHSSVIEIGVEFGAVGLAFYLWTLAAIYRGGSRVFGTAQQPINRVLSLGLLAATVCLFLLDLSGTRFRSGEIMAFYWILVGITLNSLPPQDAEIALKPHSISSVPRRSAPRSIE